MMHNFYPNIQSVSYCVWSHAILHKQFIDILLIKFSYTQCIYTTHTTVHSIQNIYTLAALYPQKVLDSQIYFSIKL